MHNCFFAPLIVVSVIQLTLPVDLPEPLLLPLPVALRVGRGPLRFAIPFGG